MFPPASRRVFLRDIGRGAAALALGSAAAAAAPIEASRLSDKFLLLTGAGGNVLAWSGPDSVLLVNGGSADASDELLKLVAKECANKPVQVLFNTCWHPEHTGSNEALGQRGAKIVAHENTKLWLGTEIDCRWQKRTYRPHPKAALPNQTFYSGVQKMTFGGEAIEYGYLMQAHTDGDIYVHFPGANILVAGDLVGAGKYPILDWSTGGWIGGMVDAQQALLKIANSSTRIIPGSGPAVTAADLQAEHDMLATVKDRMIKLMKQGLKPSEIVAAAPTKEFDAKWGDPKLFVELAYRGLWGHVRELGGIV